jgi:hypothetical protein
MSPGPLYEPQPVKVKADRYGHPLVVAGVAVEMVRERWWVEDRWWTTKPLDRRYFELVLADGRDVTVFRSRGGSRWYRQRA